MKPLSYEDFHPKIGGRYQTNSLQAHPKLHGLPNKWIGFICGQDNEIFTREQC